MALINRVSRMFRADFNAVLDQIEEPGQLVRQAIRDMEDDISATEQGIAQLARRREVLDRRAGDVKASIEELDRQLDLCFDSEKEDLARGLIRRKLESERVLKQLSGASETTAQQLADQRGRLDENRVTLDGLRQKAELFVRQVPSPCPESDDAAWPGPAMVVSDDEVEIAFLHEKTRRSAS